MTATPPDPTSAGDQQKPAAAEQSPVALTFEDQMQLLWRRNRVFILAGCVIAVVVIVGMGFWERMGQQKELEIEKAYAAAATPEALKAFADSHAGHSLAGVAYLRLADDAFATGKSADALTNYEKAIAALKSAPLLARAKVGHAISQVVSGKAAEGATALKQLAEDSSQFKGVRVEAAYHLASLAADAGNSADVIKYSDLLVQIDAASPWTQRGLALRASLPPSAMPEPKKEAAPGAAPSIQFTPTK